MLIQYPYDPARLAREYAIGGAGIAATAGPALFVEGILTPIAWVFWVLAAVFALHVIKTGIRHKTVIEFNQNGIDSKSPLGTKTIAWDRLREVKLSYFKSKRGSEASAVMTLRLKSDDTKIVVESSLKGFDRFAETVAKMCTGRPVSMDINTLHNFEALGVPVKPKE